MNGHRLCLLLLKNVSQSIAFYITRMLTIVAQKSCVITILVKRNNGKETGGTLWHISRRSQNRMCKTQETTPRDKHKSQCQATCPTQTQQIGAQSRLSRLWWWCLTHPMLGHNSWWPTYAPLRHDSFFSDMFFVSVLMYFSFHLRSTISKMFSGGAKQLGIPAEELGGPLC